MSVEAAKLTKRKKQINKGKLKKTIKNVLSRPDPVLWSVLNENEAKVLLNILSKFKVNLPEYKKLLWSEIKLIPKDKRPKQPKPEKVEGLLFGISHCARSIASGECVGILLDADITPQILVHHVIDACKQANQPYICLKDLKKTCSINFGIPTSCLGITNCDNVNEIKHKIGEYSSLFNTPNKPKIIEKTEEKVTENKVEIKNNMEEPKAEFTYLYRTSKTNRAFVPPSSDSPSAGLKDFSGQSFIKISNTSSIKNKNDVYKNMNIKKISNNPNRKRKIKEYN